ncbi:MAG: MBL fold metallo-hydrolase [Sulfolobales archaeon]
MRIYRWVVGPLRTNCYMIESLNEALIIDPGWHEGLDDMIRIIRSRSLKLIGFIATHGHFDHIAGVSRLREEFNAEFMIHERDLEIALRAHDIALRYLNIEIPRVPKPDRFIREGDLIRVGDSRIEVIETPGHSPGSVSLILRESSSGRLRIFTGDTLFKDSIGRVDIPGASPEMMRESLRKIISLPRDTLVYPGHGAETVLGREIERNNVLRSFLEDL